MPTALRRTTWMWLVAATLAPAQFHNLATTQNGSRVWFITELRQNGTGQHLNSKIFSLDSSGLMLVLEAPLPTEYESFTFDDLQAAADGSWLVYGSKRNCGSGSSCFLNEQHRSVLLQAGSNDELLGGNARLSSDGRWAFVYSSNNVLSASYYLLDRQSGKKTEVRQDARNPFLTISAEPSVSSDSTILIPTPDALVLWKNGAARAIAGAVTSAVMDDAASTAVYQDTSAHLRVIDLATAKQSPLGAFERQNTAPRISADGRWVLYLSQMHNGPQIFFSARDGSGWRQLTDQEGGIAEAVLSGDGRVAWAVTSNGAILRIDTASGAVETLIGPTPTLKTVTPGAQGSAAEISGASLEGRSVTIAGLSAPVELAEPHHLVFQVPWETPTGATELVLQPSNSDFESAFPYSVQAVAPMVVTQGACPANTDCQPPVAFHQDWASLVTETNPAIVGEVIHIYGTGFGPVNPPVATGAISPAQPLSYTTTYLEWAWPSEKTGAEVLFSGLAPGLIGYYQLDVRIPPTVSVPLEELTVRWALGFQSFGYIPVSQRIKVGATQGDTPTASENRGLLGVPQLLK